jgi:large subunit ribosomal protein L25
MPAAYISLFHEKVVFMAEVFNVAHRSEVGRLANKRLRRTGQIPAVLYGHGEASISLSIKRDEVDAALRHSGKVVKLQGDVTEEALIREVQWDAFGMEVLHVDLIRVSQSETVEVNIAVHLRGESPGVRAGGIVNHVLHEVTITCPVSNIPEHLELSLVNLQLDESLHAADVPLPEGATLITDPNLVIVNCNAPAGDEEEVPGGVAVEPELIRKDKGDEGEG